MNNKNKLFIRIICGIIIFVMVLGMIVPYVSAAEKPDDILPAGYEYVDRNGTWYVEKTSPNRTSAFVISILPENYDCGTVTIFIGNLETQDVVTLNLKLEDHYIGNLDLADGYYVIFSNRYAFCGTDGKGYSISGTDNMYFYVGDNAAFDSDKYPVSFHRLEHDRALYQLTLLRAPEIFQHVGATTVLNIDNSKLELPDSVRKEALGQEDNGSSDNTSDDATDPNAPTTTDTPSGTTPSNKDDNKNDSGIFWGKIILDSLKDSALLIIAAIGCYIGITIIKIKKNKERDEQNKNDQYDDKRIE